jgi:hypothetical protein
MEFLSPTTLAELGEAVSSIRFECAAGAYFHSYHTMARWVFQTMKSGTVVRVGERVIKATTDGSSAEARLLGDGS